MPQATVFVSSFCVMVIELVAGRVISRHLGSSLYTWTSVIGIVLAGLAAGNYLGGRLADRRPARPTLAFLFLLASVTCVAIIVLNRQVGDWVFLWTLPWPARVGTHVAIVFLVPSLLLGMISPVAAKMALDRSRQTGRTIGSVYAWGVIGSIGGTFAAGFWLIAAFGTAAIVWTIGGVLAVVGLLFGSVSRFGRVWVVVFFALALLGTGPWSWAVGFGERLSLRESHPSDLIWVDESQYSHIRVYQVSKNPDTRNMHLDKLLHSSIVLDRPEELQYGYERIYGAVTKWMASGGDSLHTLTIGGGGYVFPRWIEIGWPRSLTEVVEIDPAVTEAAIEAFGLPVDHGFRIAHADGRAHVRRLLEGRRRGETRLPYDFVYVDAVNDYQVPYQLTTVEFLRQVDELLAPDGAYLMNMIDVYSVGRFLGSMISTMEAVFPHVAVFAEGRAVSDQPDVRNTYILAGTKRPVDFSGMVEGYDRRFGLYRLTEAELGELRSRTGRILTDDWAPVENFLAPVVKGSSRELAGAFLAKRASDRLREGRREKALREAERAVELAPRSWESHDVLASARLATGDVDGAIEEYREVVRLHASAAAVWHRLGVLLAERGRTAEAVDAYERAIALEPDHVEARNDLGIALVRIGRLEEAVARFAEALEIDPRHAKAGTNLELARRMLRDRE